ncbi:hypothetical protein CYR32_19400 [Chimaeribacter coloradensis]|uniref:Uncharacterized protein n=1 Tax=Chimaeribacter coloradensis TaxID=2060068 RepID=A0A2N5DTU6_9GAMM|nr:hypothetical protein [Chimaeribacter coloradensis]PLR30082.1 hypothetical protein CYR32_19400 [Chimaeribacter coloradensis]
MGKSKRRQQKKPKKVCPRLIPPVDNWDEDLPDPAEQQQAPPQLIRVNEINSIWMEIPRYVNHGWGGLWFVVIILLMPVYISGESFIYFSAINDIFLLWHFL